MKIYTLVAILALVLFERPSHANDYQKNIIIKIEHSSIVLSDWAKALCRDTAITLDHVLDVPAKAHCFFNENKNSQVDLLIKKKISQTSADFELDLKRELDGNISVQFINLKQVDKNFANKAGWKIFNTERFQFDLRERLLESIFLISHPDYVRDALVEIIANEQKIQYDRNKYGSRDEFYGEIKRSPFWNANSRKFLTAGSELLMALSVGYYGYHHLSDNTMDYDFKKEGFIAALKNKITGGYMVRYDDNGWGTNRGHAFAGVGYYLICRGNGLTNLESLLCSIAGSTAWESVVEWREVFSINDQIFTAAGGAVLGEALFEMGNYIDKRGPEWLKTLTGLKRKNSYKFSNNLNRRLFNGMDSDLDFETTKDSIDHGRFEFEIGTVQISDGKTVKRVGLSNEVNLISLSEDAGQSSRFIKKLVATQFNFDASTEAISDQYDIFAKTVLAAYYQKQISIDENEIKNGYTFYVGPSAAFEIKDSRILDNDFIGIVHIIGSTAQLTNYYKGVKITSTLDIWGDSAMVKSFMIEEYKSNNGVDDIVHNLASADYYHGWGMTTKAQVIVELNNLAVGASISDTRTKNTNQRQRELEIDLKELNIQDERLSAELFIERKIGKNFKVRFSRKINMRSGSIDGSSGRSTTTSNRIALVYYF
jgi:hypothetical protein